MPIEQRPSNTWPADRARDENTVIGDESLVVGDEYDSAAKLIELLFGSPYPSIRRVIDGRGAVMRGRSYTVRVRRVARSGS